VPNSYIKTNRQTGNNKTCTNTANYKNSVMFCKNAGQWHRGWASAGVWADGESSSGQKIFVKNWKI